MRQIYSVLAILCISLPTMAQTEANRQTLSLDSCRAMALRNNHNLAIGKMEQDIAYNTRKAARTKYLPRVTALGGYEWTSKELSILSSAQKSLFSNLGTTLVSKMTSPITDYVGSLVQQGAITPEQAGQLAQQIGQLTQPLADKGNAAGQNVVDAFRTDTRNIWAGTVMVTQPIYMGGAITALNNIADIQESLAKNDLDRRTQATLYDIDNSYWLVVSLKHKYALAKSFNKLVCKLNDNVQKMIKEGVATKADGLKVAVKVNESEMALTQCENGISLAKMLLCQQCGLPLDTELTLADEDLDNLAIVEHSDTINTHEAINNRPETRLLQNAVDMTKEVTHITKAAFLPQLGLTAGYLISNPNVFDSFSKKFGGVFNVGVILRVPVWNWFEGMYKVRATKSATAIAEYKLEEAKEMMELQVNQQRFKVSEATKRLAMAQKNINSAEENLRCADLGFKEGVMTSTDVIGAQTAWYQAQTQKIDAEIEVRMSQLSLKKALGQVN